MGEPVVQREGPWVLVSSAVSRAGQVRMTAVSEGVQLGTCRARAPAGATVTCRFDLPEADSRDHHQHGAMTSADARATVTHVDTEGRETSRMASG